MRRRSVNRSHENRLRSAKRGSSCGCYCKLKETINDESSTLSSQRFIEKNTGNKCNKMTPPTTTIDLGIQSPNKQQFERNVCGSPTLSPDTQKAIENAEKILEDARCKIVEVARLSTTGSSRGAKKELYADDLEPPLDDETEGNLYIRELVSSRLNKITNEINEDSDVSTDRKKVIKDKVTKKRSIDFLAPKFQTKERRFKDILYRSTNHCNGPMEQIKSDKSKYTVSNERKSNYLSVDSETCKTKSLTIQKGPSLNIDRELKKQDLGFVHISPDTSYVESNRNINFYSFCHESYKKKDTSLKNMVKEQDDKLIDNVTTDVIDKLNRSTSENTKLTRDIKILEGTSFAKNDVAILTNVVGKEYDVLFEGPINNGQEKKDRENVSEHLPRTGVDYFTLNDEPNSYYSNDARKNEDLRCKGKNIIPKINIRDIGTDVQSSLSEDKRNDTISSCNDDKNLNCYGKRTKDEATKTDGNNEKYRRTKTNHVNSVKSIRTIHEHDINEKFHKVIDKRFSDVIAKHDSNSGTSNESEKCNVGKDSIDVSGMSLQDTDTSFNDIELNAPSIETFDNILLAYDKVIDRVSKSEKKIGDTLKRLELSLSTESWKPIITNTAVKPYGLVPSKTTDNYRNVNKNDGRLLLSDNSKSMIVERKEDTVEINPSMSNYVLKEDDLSFFKKKYHLKNESHLIKKRSQKVNDAIRSNESCSSIENITDENKVSELQHKIKALLCDEKLGNYESRKDDVHIESLMLKSEEWRERKFEFERAIVNNLPGVRHTPSMLEEIIKHLQTFSNARSQDVPILLKNFIMDVMNHDSGLVLDFLSMQKSDNGTAHTNLTQNGGPLQAIAQGNECKIHKDVITDSHVLQESSLLYNSGRFITSKEKSLKVCPVNLIEIKPTDVIDELCQTKIEVLEKSTQYEVSCKQNDHDGDDKINKNISSDKSNMENIVKTNKKVEEYPTKEIEINNSDITKLQFIKNDDSENNSKSSEANIISTDHVKNAIMNHLCSESNISKNILDKLSDSEDSSSHIGMNNLKRTHTNVSRFTTTSSETSHSEGELFLPSSCSYSLGEVRIAKNSASMCNRAFVSTSTPSCIGETTSLLRHSSGEIYVDSSDTL